VCWYGKDNSKRKDKGSGSPDQPKFQGKGERQPLPNVWTVVERSAWLHMPDADQLPSEEYRREMRELWRLDSEIHEKGTDRDKLILELFSSAIILRRNPTASWPNLYYQRKLNSSVPRLN
jgi:hypothetical protein